MYSRAALFCLLLLIVGPMEAIPAANGTRKKMELVSRIGRRAAVRLYSGESLTFRAREVRDGLAGIFDSGDFLHGVSFRLREWPRVKQDATAMVKGVNRGLVREKKPEPKLWGMPVSWFTVEDERPGRYVLEAKRPGFHPARVVIHAAALAVLVNDGELSERHYTANFDVELDDPAEPGRPIPIFLESLDEDGGIVDSRKDLRLAPVGGKVAVYRTNVSVNLSSTIIESFEERRKRAKQSPLPPLFYAAHPLRVVEGGSIRVSVRNLHAVYPLPLGY